MSKLKKPQKVKITRLENAVTISFSFAYLTTNKSYNFQYFGSDIRKELETRKILDELLLVLSNSTWEDVAKRNRTEFGGREKIPYKQLNFTPTEYKFSGDDKFHSFRFGDSRLIGLKQGDVLYILGYDFDFSAYNHGS